ncbi:MAG: tRNA lysidine(34) synthetase TilS [Bryobacteraceae bacterium]
MLKRVAEFISRYSMFTRGQTVGVAVSGGADSVCLLHVLQEISPRWALKLMVLHLDHRLRGEESDADACFVRDLASSAGLEAVVRQVDVRRIQAETADNLEQAARKARYAFFRDCLESGRVDRIALGHTRSDQAETVLFRFLRGCGSTGLAGILPVTREGWVRPLLDVDREEIERYLRGRGIEWREDSSNRDPAYARNRIRRRLLPELIRDWNPALVEVLANTATLARDEESYWEGEVDRLAEANFVRERSGVLLRAGCLRDLAVPVARRLVRRAIRDAKGDLTRIEFSHIEGVLRLARGKEGRGAVRLPGLQAARSFDWLRLARPEDRETAAPFRVPVPTEGALTASVGGVRVELSVSDCDKDHCGLDWERIPKPLEVRSWSSGDRYRPLGHVTEQEIRLLFQKHKVPSWERGQWPVLASGETVLWARRFGPAAEYAAGADTRRVLKVQVDQDLTDTGNQKAVF